MKIQLIIFIGCVVASIALPDRSFSNIKAGDVELQHEVDVSEGVADRLADGSNSDDLESTAFTIEPDVEKNGPVWVRRRHNDNRREWLRHGTGRRLESTTSTIEPDAENNEPVWLKMKIELIFIVVCVVASIALPERNFPNIKDGGMELQHEGNASEGAADGSTSDELEATTSSVGPDVGNKNGPVWIEYLIPMIFYSATIGRELITSSDSGRSMIR
ncbi:hypothetical protein Bhyg_03738 [Pseudolycoriella hygida]|uniref:Uncharacterized protein n=1 Tax=Pseudolycoriella hygida TaxID=35572 RepID=A0A9Q0NE93_9DIPT|nr:hypothetical protein Bhyg_03738 [Pseudolycoriella hygida]